jgi:hypothetical protein
MRKVIYVLMIVAGTFMFASCKSSGVAPIPAHIDTKEIEPSSIILGWVDDNTFRVKAGGTHAQTAGTPGEKKARAKENAVERAQTIVIEKFVGDRVKRAGVMMDPRSTGVSITNEFGKSVKNGTVLHEKYDRNNNVEIIYQVSAPELKQKVEVRDRK